MSTSLIIFLFFIVFISFLTTIARKKRRRYKSKSKNNLYYKNQLFTNKYKRENAILRSTFSKKSLFYVGESIAFRYTRKYLIDNKLDYHIFPQIPLIAFLDEISSDINIHQGLRPDFVLVNYDFEVVAVMEIDGQGHNHQTDRAKSLILESVSIPIISVDIRSWNEKTQSYNNYVASKVQEALNSHFFSNN